MPADDVQKSKYLALWRKWSAHLTDIQEVVDSSSTEATRDLG